MNNIELKGECKSITYRIWIAGDYDSAVQLCRKYTLVGLCVSLQKTDYIYTFGMETGICATLINYPRFPVDEQKMHEVAVDLGMYLCENLYQSSFSVEGPKKTYFYSRRKNE